MRHLKRFGGTVGITAALMLVSGGWAASTEAAIGASPAVHVPETVGGAFREAVQADSILGAAVPTLITLQPTLEQRRGRSAAGRAAPPRGGEGRVRQPRARGGRTVVVRPGRYYRPYGYRLGLGFGYAYPYGYGYPYYYGGYYGYYGGSYAYTGSVRLKVKPEHAEILVDGYYVGTVDDFDGTFQSLKLEPGPATIEVRAPGFESVRLDVRILPGRTITYQENMRAGDPGPAPQTPPAAGRPPVRDPAPGATRGRPVPPDPDAAPGPLPEYDVQPPAFGGVRLRVEPRNAQVFVDGYFVGTVDDFDSGNGLPLESGPQDIEIRAEGYEPLQLQIRILPDETTTYEGDLTPVSGR
jgi:hypothetical protein